MSLSAPPQLRLLKPGIFLVVVAFVALYFYQPRWEDISALVVEEHYLTANASLGFGSVIAVSRDGSPRREGLMRAANLTDIKIDIPKQPKWTDAQVDELRSKKQTRLSRGSALAWLGHLNALQWFLDSGLESALILEDDVDWDTHLRSSQIPQVASAIRNLSGSKSDFYGDVHTWDILYIGHCGDMFKAERALKMDIQVFNDSSLPTFDEMHPWTRKFLDSLGVAEGLRLVHPSIMPLCSFGYAVTRRSAYRMLHEFAAKEPENGCQAFDVRLLEACRNTDVNCITVNPELFHHLNAESEIAAANHVDEQGRIKTPPKGSNDAPNIRCSARSFATQKGAAFDELRAMVKRPHQCFKSPDGATEGVELS